MTPETRPLVPTVGAGDRTSAPGSPDPMTEGEPLLRVVKGHPTRDETAALALVIAARLALRRADREPGAPPGATVRRGWAGHARALRIPPAPGPGGWRDSARPG